MEYIIKLTAICIVAGIFSLLIKKINPEFSLLIGTCTAVLCLYFCVHFYCFIIEQFNEWQGLVLLQKEYFAPLMKCLGISIVSRMGVGLCKDAGQTAAATGLELCSSAASVYCLIPLINHLFMILENML